MANFFMPGFINIKYILVLCLFCPLSLFAQKKDEAHIEAVYQKAVGVGGNYYFNISKGEKKHIPDNNMYDRLLFSNHFVVGGVKYFYSASEKSVVSLSTGYQYAPGLGLFTFYTNAEGRLVYYTNFNNNDLRAELRIGTDLLFPYRIQVLYSPHIGGKRFDGISNFGISLMYSLSKNKYVIIRASATRFSMRNPVNIGTETMAPAPHQRLVCPGCEPAY